ncbi:hypothetical protein HYV70_00920 [Candidatus Uhrbacteria bacterium]|nr:hypothetical protein [Candidatus Uhrbacteria bacterium]
MSRLRSHQVGHGSGSPATTSKKDAYSAFQSLSGRFKAGGEIHGEELFELAVSTTRNFSGMDSTQVLEIFHFLLSFRVRMDERDIRSFSNKIEKIARYLSPKISRNGEMILNPFLGRLTTGHQLRTTINREATRVGQIEAALVFV